MVLTTIIVLATYKFLLHVCLCAPDVVFYTYWERPSRLHWSPCVIELKWAWFMLGPTEFPSWRLLLQTFQLVYTTRLERTVAKSSLCPQTIPQRSLEWVQTDFVAGNGVTWSAPPIWCWFPAVQVAVAVLNYSQLHFTFSSFFMCFLDHWWNVFKQPEREVQLFLQLWFTLPEMKTNTHLLRIKTAFPEAWCTMFVSGATEVNLASLAQETGSD